ncbi:MAG: SDR family oxidoreductase [Steroidobacteraceae bacterium]
MENAARISLDLSGRACLVTGAGQGIGQSIACTFAAHGALVLVADLVAARAESVAAQIRDAGGVAMAAVGDVSDKGACEVLVATAAQRFGRLDMLVHNAAYFPLTPFARIDEQVLERTLAVNLKAAFWLTQAALPLLRQSPQGRVLLTSSVTGPRVAYPGLAHYAASKSGLNGFIRAAALELARDRITVNGVEPGMIATPAQDNLGDPAHMESLREGVPLGRLGSPADIAAAMLFLACDAASYITGQTLVVDGGALLPESRTALDSP